MKVRNFKTILFSCLIFGLAYFVLNSLYFEKEINFDKQIKKENFNNSEISIFL